MYPWTCPQLPRGTHQTQETKKTRNTVESLNQTTRNTKNLRHTFAARSCRVRGPTLWNQLPEHVKKIKGYSTFKKHPKTFYFKKNPIYLNQCPMFSALDKTYCFPSILYKFAFIYSDRALHKEMEHIRKAPQACNFPPLVSTFHKTN